MQSEERSRTSFHQSCRKPENRPSVRRDLSEICKLGGDGTCHPKIRDEDQTLIRLTFPQGIDVAHFPLNMKKPLFTLLGAAVRFLPAPVLIGVP